MEKYTIEVESIDYDTKKEFKHITMMDTRQYMELVMVILDYLDTITTPTTEVE